MMIPLKELGDVKVGDTVEMRVASITDGMALLKPAETEPAAQEAGEDAMPPMPSKEEAMKMPMDELEKKLPKANRE